MIRLNKGCPEQQYPPMCGRPLPARPNSYPNQYSIYYDRIEEHKPSPSLTPEQPTYATSQRSSLASENPHYEIPMQFFTPINPAVPQEPVNPGLS